MLNAKNWSLALGGIFTITYVIGLVESFFYGAFGAALFVALHNRSATASG